MLTPAAKRAAIYSAFSDIDRQRLVALTLEMRDSGFSNWTFASIATHTDNAQKGKVDVPSMKNKDNLSTEQMRVLRFANAELRHLPVRPARVSSSSTQADGNREPDGKKGRLLAG
eukprot:SAG22_NODE_2745_length_2257_cov_1.690918_4_plen_114_part_01